MLEGYLGREKALREMMDMMMGSYQNSASSAVGDHENQRRQLGDPIQDAQRELARINEILKTPAVPPQVPTHLHEGGIR